MMLHVACLPFPSHQGTQAAIAAMLHASAEAGRQPQLLTYAHGAHPLDPRYELHRVPDFPKVRSLRSGPSLGKIALDFRCIQEIRRLARRSTPEAIVAHHIEAALAAMSANVAPVYYVAHTALSRELSVYFPRLPASPVDAIGDRLERFVTRRAARVAAISPSLAALFGADVTYLPVPWSPVPQSTTQEQARSTLGIPADAEVCLYAGNLDRYQGWELLVEALAELRRAHPRARLLVATESSPSPVLVEATRHGIGESVDIRRLSGEAARAQVHAASDVAWVPRRTEGGLPIKMLDALGRGLPVVATKRATAGLPVLEACEVVPDDDPYALSAGAARLLRDRDRADALRAAGTGYLWSHHGKEAFLSALDRWIGTAYASSSKATRPGPRPPAARERRAR